MDTSSPQEPSEDETDSSFFTPLPSSSQGQSAFSITSTLLPVVNDRRAMLKLLGFLLRKSNRSAADVAESMGIQASCVQQYMRGKRPKMGLEWFLRFVQACGGKVRIEF
jgi:hypothetical protein